MKQQELLRKLKARYLALMYAKWAAYELEEDMEYHDRIPELKAKFNEVWFKAHDRGLDPAAICVQIIRRYWKPPHQR
jgi:hypothetical protein